MKSSSINPITFDFYEIATVKTKIHDKVANLKGIKILNCIMQNTEIYADKDMIELVLRNLITNAIKFSSDGDIITITSTTGNGFVKVCVADNGIGISLEDIEKLFGKQVFTIRGTLNEKGTGLGLILCRDFVNINGGTIWVESEVNKGSKFFFTVPAKQNS